MTPNYVTKSCTDRFHNEHWLLKSLCFIGQPQDMFIVNKCTCVSGTEHRTQNTEALNNVPLTRIPHITTNQQHLVVLLDPHYVRMHLLYFLKCSYCFSNYRGAVIQYPSCRLTFHQMLQSVYSHSVLFCIAYTCFVLATLRN